MSERDKEFYDLVYDVWRAGGNPDAVTHDRFEDVYDGQYDFVFDEQTLRAELQHQRKEPTEQYDKGEKV